MTTTPRSFNVARRGFSCNRLDAVSSESGLPNKFSKDPMPEHHVGWKKFEEQFRKNGEAADKPLRFIFLDTETTGLSEDRDRVVEIGAFEVVGGRITGTYFHTLLHPGMSIPLEAEQIHQISNQMVNHKACPVFEDVAEDMLFFLKDAVVIAQNASFDMKMLDAELSRLRQDLINRGFFEEPSRANQDPQEAVPSMRQLTRGIYDTLPMARSFFTKDIKPEGGKFNLDALCNMAGVDLKLRQSMGHGALLDSLLTMSVVDFAMRVDGNNRLFHKVTLEDWKRPPVNFFGSAFRNLPEVPAKPRWSSNAAPSSTSDQAPVTPKSPRMG